MKRIAAIYLAVCMVLCACSTEKTEINPETQAAVESPATVEKIETVEIVLETETVPPKQKSVRKTTTTAPDREEIEASTEEFVDADDVEIIEDTQEPGTEDDEMHPEGWDDPETYEDTEVWEDIDPDTCSHEYTFSDAYLENNELLDLYICEKCGHCYTKKFEFETE